MQRAVFFKAAVSELCFSPCAYNNTLTAAGLVKAKVLHILAVASGACIQEVLRTPGQSPLSLPMLMLLLLSS